MYFDKYTIFQCVKLYCSCAINIWWGWVLVYGFLSCLPHRVGCGRPKSREHELLWTQALAARLLLSYLQNWFLYCIVKLESSKLELHTKTFQLTTSRTDDSKFQKNRKIGAHTPWGLLFWQHHLATKTFNMVAIFQDDHHWLLDFAIKSQRLVRF